MTELTAEIEKTLKEYTQLQQEEQKLKERKQALREKLKAHLRSSGDHVWTPNVNEMQLKIRYRSAANVQYDEEKLRTRLGDRYHALLKPDLKKLRAELPNIENELEPLLDRIGSPSPEKVKAAVESGTVSAADFKGAFKKTVKEYLTVTVLKKNDGLK